MATQAAGTAYGPMFIVALEKYYSAQQRLADDKVAYQLFSPILRILIKLSRFLPIRRLIFNLSEARAPGVWAGVLCRKRYIDEKVIQAFEMGMDSIVILGAGLDTLAYRKFSPIKVRFFEVDLPENIAYKKAMLKKIFGRIPAHVSLIPIDFEKQELEKALDFHGYHNRQKSLFIWEGVTQYLTEAAVRKTMHFLSQAQRGSKLIFTYIRKDFIQGKKLYGLEGLYHSYKEKTHLWHFGLAPEEVAVFLKQYGWQEVEQMGSEEYKKQYVKPTGRELMVMQIERAVYAEKK